MLENNVFMNRQSIRQANSRLHAFGIEASLEKDLFQKIQDEKVQIDTAIPPSYFNSTNPCLKMPGTQRRLKNKTLEFKDPFATAPMEAWQETKGYNLQVNGLPTLEEMMQLNTYSPLTQSHFAAFLKSRQAHQNLRFLMKLDTHEKLWRAYLSSIDRQNRQRLSRFLESAAEKEDRQDLLEIGYREVSDTKDLLSPTTPPRADVGITMPTEDNKPLNRNDLVKNANEIYHTFSGTIHLPQDHQKALEQLVLYGGRPEPVVFESARTHVFEILNIFYYPLFIDKVLNKNISLGTSRLCLVLGVIMLTIGFSLELSLVFLDSSSSRWFALIPFFFGWSTLLTSVTEFAWWFGITSVR